MRQYRPEVDYPYLKLRLGYEDTPELVLHLAEYRDDKERDECKPASGQQIDEVALDRVLMYSKRICNISIMMANIGTLCTLPATSNKPFLNK